MAVLTPVLWKSRVNAKGESPIYLRIEAGNKRQYFSLRVFIKPRHWNKEKGRVRKTHPLFDEINSVIELKLNESQKAILRLRVNGSTVTPAVIKKTLQPTKASEVDLIAYGQECAADLRKADKVSTAHRYESVMRKLARFHGQRLYFTDLDNSLLRKYHLYMASELGNNQSTMASNFRAIRTIVNRAVKDGIFPADEKLFHGISFVEPGGEKRKLRVDEIRAIQDLELELDSPHWRARAYWLVSMYLGGMRFRDVADLRVKSIQGGRLNYRMSKTRKFKNIDIPVPAMEIINHFGPDLSDLESRVFPILSGYNTRTADNIRRAVSSQNAYINRLLKEVAAKAKVYPRLSFHQSRHSFANMAIEAGWSVRKIQSALGHQDLDTTERYLRDLGAEMAGNEMEKLFQQ